MNSKSLIIYVTVLVTFLGSWLFAQQEINEKLKAKLALIEESLHEQDMQLKTLEMSELDFEMQNLELSLQAREQSLSHCNSYLFRQRQETRKNKVLHKTHNRCGVVKEL